MGFAYAIAPFDSAVAAQMDELGLSHPVPRQVSRYPTSSEIRQVLDSLDGYVTTYEGAGRRWQATIESEDDGQRGSALLNSIDYLGDNTPLDFEFEDGSPELVFRIVEQLTGICGPLAVVPDYPAIPLLVIPGSAPGDLLRMWNSFQEAFKLEDDDEAEDEPR